MNAALAVTYVYLAGFVLVGASFLAHYRANHAGVLDDEAFRDASVLLAFLWPALFCALLVAFLFLFVMVIVGFVEDLIA